jgi:Choline/ethanolamine kinase
VQTLLPRSSSAEWVAAPTTAIKLIDYEYSGVNAVAYDIANHWCIPWRRQ